MSAFVNSCAEHTARSAGRGAAASYGNSRSEAEPRARAGRRHAFGSQTTPTGPKPYPVKFC